MTSEQVRLLKQLMRAAVKDLGSAYSATWSKSRLYTVLAGQCIGDGHQVVEPVVTGTPAHLHRVNQPGPSHDDPDLQISHKDGGRLLFVDLLVGTLEGRGEGGLSLEDAHRSISRVHQGKIDALIIAADALAYGQMHSPGEEGLVHQRRVVSSVLPRSDLLSASAHRKVVGDITLETVGSSFAAFGVPRVVSATYVLAY
jgi:hypothetical protein